MTSYYPNTSDNADNFLVTKMPDSTFAMRSRCVVAPINRTHDLDTRWGAIHLNLRPFITYMANRSPITQKDLSKQ